MVYHDNHQLLLTLVSIIFLSGNKNLFSELLNSITHGYFISSINTSDVSFSYNYLTLLIILRCHYFDVKTFSMIIVELDISFNFMISILCNQVQCIALHITPALQHSLKYLISTSRKYCTLWLQLQCLYSTAVVSWNDTTLILIIMNCVITVCMFISKLINKWIISDHLIFYDVTNRLSFVDIQRIMGCEKYTKLIAVV